MGLLEDIAALSEVRGEEFALSSPGGGKFFAAALQIPASVLGSGAASLISPITRPMTYKGNEIAPLVIPGPELAFQMYAQGFITEEQLRGLMLKHGIDITGKILGAPWDWVWKEAFLSMTTKLSIGNINLAWAMGWLNDNSYDKWLRRNGVWDSTVADIIKRSRQAVYSVGNILTFRNRGFIDDKTALQHLKANGYIDPATATRVLSMRVPVPAIGELLTYAARYVSDDTVAADYGLDTDRANLDQGTVGKWFAIHGVSAEQKTAMWRAHWTSPGLATLLDMARKFRSPDRVRLYREVVPGTEEVTLDEVRSAAVRDGIAPGWVDNLAALTYNPIPLRQLRIMLEESQADKTDVENSLLDQGFIPSQARKLATALDIKVRRPVLDPILRVARGSIETGYRIGALSKDQALALLKQYGLRLNEADAALAALDVEVAIEQSKELLAGVRKMRLDGAFTHDQAVAKLVELGFMANRAEQQAQIWDVQLETGRARVSAGLLLKWLEAGIIEPADFVNRLRNLGFSDRDITSYLLAASQELDQAALKALAAAAKTREQQAKALAAREAALARAHRQAIADLRSHGSPGQIARWFSRGLMSLDDALARLITLGWPEEDALNLLAAAEPKPKLPRPVKPPKPAKPGPTTIVIPKPVIAKPPSPHK